MRTRLEDLLATADRQLASRSYDAAINTYRTALTEPGAAEAGVEERLEAACRVRDEARGIVRQEEPPAPPEEAPEAAPVPEPAPPVVDIQPEPRPEPAPEPAPEPVIESRPVEPPAFALLEPEMFETRASREYPLEVENLSILHPTPAPEEPEDSQVLPRLAIAALIFIAVCAVAILLK
jgi:hypothetical protein